MLIHGLYPHLGFDYSLNYITGPQVCFVELFLWSTRRGSSLSCSADCLSRQISGIQMFFCRAESQHSLSFPRPPEPRWARLPVCLRGTRLPQVAHMSSASRSHNTGSVIDPKQMLAGKKKPKKNVPLAALVELCSSTLVLILPPTWCNPQDVVHNLVKQIQWVMERFCSPDGKI